MVQLDKSIKLFVTISEQELKFVYTDIKEIVLFLVFEIVSNDSFISVTTITNNEFNYTIIITNID